MTDKAIYYKVMQHDKIYSLLYSPIRIKKKSLEDQIIEIPVTELEWAKDYKSFFMYGVGPAQIVINMMLQHMVKDGALLNKKLLIVGKSMKHEQSRKKSSQTD